MVDHVYQSQGYGEYRNGSHGTRQKARESVVTATPEWVVGLPKDIQFKGKRGGMITLNLVAMVSKVEPSWLVEVAPQLVKEEAGLSPRYDSTQDTVVSTTRIHFNGRVVEERVVADPEHSEAATVFCSWLAGQMAI
jgi:hypothetical protein